MIQENFNNEPHHSSDELRDRIIKNRIRVSHTIDAIGHELNPQRFIENYIDETSEVLIANAKEKASSATNTAVQAIKDNPIPALLFAASLAYFITKLTTAEKEPEPITRSGTINTKQRTNT